jgi:ubiquinol-cytochrome c reductase iron-sulfur subunit
VTWRIVGLVVGLGAALTGVLAAWVSKRLAPGEPDEEPREQKGPDQRRRRLILGAGAGAAALTATAVAFPAARRAGSASDRLRSTSWSDGRRVVDAEGVLIRADEVAIGELITVYPEGAIDTIDSQAVLIRESLSRFVPDPERPDWIPEGIAVYSKLCTHMACPLGLYQQRSGTLLCPCHQAVFDLLDGGRAVQGPARRALPQLPLRIDVDGHLVARGDFSDAVGTGFWGRP